MPSGESGRSQPPATRMQANHKILLSKWLPPNYIHSLELTWKWRMAPWKTIFHYKQVVFHFHVNSRESTSSMTLANKTLLSMPKEKTLFEGSGLTWRLRLSKGAPLGFHADPQRMEQMHSHSFTVHLLVTASRCGCRFFVYASHLNTPTRCRFASEAMAFAPASGASPSCRTTVERRQGAWSALHPWPSVCVVGRPLTLLSAVNTAEC